jgi:hypothetical protein
MGGDEYLDNIVFPGNFWNKKAGFNRFGGEGLFSWLD